MVQQSAMDSLCHCSIEGDMLAPVSSSSQQDWLWCETCIPVQSSRFRQGFFPQYILARQAPPPVKPQAALVSVTSPSPQIMSYCIVHLLKPSSVRFSEIFLPWLPRIILNWHNFKSAAVDWFHLQGGQWRIRSWWGRNCIEGKTSLLASYLLALFYSRLAQSKGHGFTMISCWRSWRSKLSSSPGVMMFPFDWFCTKEGAAFSLEFLRHSYSSDEYRVLF
jgi:hypothetical protein